MFDVKEANGKLFVRSWSGGRGAEARSAGVREEDVGMKKFLLSSLSPHHASRLMGGSSSILRLHPRPSPANTKRGVFPTCRSSPTPCHGTL